MDPLWRNTPATKSPERAQWRCSQEYGQETQDVVDPSRQVTPEPRGLRKVPLHSAWPSARETPRVVGIGSVRDAPTQIGVGDAALAGRVPADCQAAAASPATRNMKAAERRRRNALSVRVDPTITATDVIGVRYPTGYRPTRQGGSGSSHACTTYLTTASAAMGQATPTTPVSSSNRHGRAFRPRLREAIWLATAPDTGLECHGREERCPTLSLELRQL